MRRMGILLALLVSSTAFAQADKREYTLTVSGATAVSAPRDEANISLTIEVKSERSLMEAIHEQKQRSSRLLRFLKDSSVPESSIEQTEVYRGAEYQYRDKTRITIYVSRQRLRIRTNIDVAPTVVDGIGDQATLDGVSYAVSNERELRESIVQSAIEDAQARAQRRAQQLGIQLGPVVAFQESELGAPRAQDEGMNRMSGMQESSAPMEMPAGESELRVNVSITYRIKVPE